MLQSTRQRWVVLGGLLLATVIASVWPRGDKSTAPEVVAPSARVNKVTPKLGRTAPAPPGLPPLGERLERPQAATQVENLFAPTSWNPPLAKQPVVAAPPSAPPFPYAIGGNLIDKDVRTVVFMKQNQYFVLGLGEVLENTYRLDEIDSRSVTVTYLPLGHRQTLPLGTLN